MAIKKTTKKVITTAPSKSRKKLYILDTNVLIHDPKALFAFDDVQIGIPSMVLEELDSFKHEGTDRGRNARETIRSLDGLRQQGSLREGVKLANGSTVQVLFLAENDLPEIPFQLASGDNEILLTALWYQQQGYDVKFISKDLNARVKADALGIATQDYLKEHISVEEFYHGWIRLEVPSVELKQEFPAVLQEVAAGLAYNQFVLVEARHNPYSYRIFRYLGNKKFKTVHAPNLRWPLQPRNPQQLMALDLMFDPAVQFICLFGPAGTGKTFLALLSGLHQVLVEHEYQKMLVSRPVIPLGRDIGYLPGTLEEKLYSWMLPIYDNVQQIVHATNADAHLQEVKHEGGQHEKYNEKYKKNGRRHRGKFQKKDHKGNGNFLSLDDLVKQDKISLEAITYMRGRSIPYQFILIDEAQNLTPHEVKTLVTRVGDGSKIVLAGDPYQIDSPYLDFSSNGLVVASERFKGQELFGSVYLPTSERSRLSELAGKLL